VQGLKTQQNGVDYERMFFIDMLCRLWLLQKCFDEQKSKYN